MGQEAPSFSEAGKEARAEQERRSPGSVLLKRPKPTAESYFRILEFAMSYGTALLYWGELG